MNSIEIEKDIEILNKYINFNEICGTGNFKQAIENILSDRERLKKEKEIHIKIEQEYKKEYLDTKEKYDNLIEKIKEIINNLEKRDIYKLFEDILIDLQKILKTEQEKNNGKKI